MPFISFSYQIAMISPFNLFMLNENLVPDLKDKAESFKFVICSLYCVEICSFYTHFVETCYHKSDAECYQMLYVQLLTWLYDFCSSFC